MRRRLIALTLALLIPIGIAATTVSHSAPAARGGFGEWPV